MHADTVTFANTNYGYFLKPSATQIPDFYERSMAAALAEAIKGSAKFHLNKLMHLAVSSYATKKKTYLANAGRIPYFVGLDDQGILRGGNPHWGYLQNFCDASLSDEQNHKRLCGELARLPSNVAFAFKLRPDLQDAKIVHSAFVKSGFTNIAHKTFLYNGIGDAEDPIKKIKSDARTKVNQARRDLEIVNTMTVDEYCTFYRENIEEDNRVPHFFLNIDHDVFKQGVAQGKNIEIIAVRRKTGEDGKVHPIEAAFLCAWDSDNYYKLVRISFRLNAAQNGGIEPHKHAVKMLVVEAMKRASERGMLLDVDGATNGGATIYRRFGVFEEVLRDEFKRKTASTFLVKFIKPEWMGKLGRMAAMSSVLFFA